MTLSGPRGRRNQSPLPGRYMQTAATRTTAA